MDNSSIEDLHLSDFHKKILGIIKECFPDHSIETNHPIKIGNKTFYIDIYIPRLKIAIECDGRQHFDFIRLYQQDSSSLKNQKSNDKLKDDFCTTNNITMVRIKYNEKIEKIYISEKILKALSNKQIEE